MIYDFGIPSQKLSMYCDNLNAICISKNPVQHSRTKHIDIRHHFIRDMVENDKLSISHIFTEKQPADLLTKALDVSRFETLRTTLGICTI